MSDKLIPTIVAIATAVAAFSGGTYADMSGAKAWKEANMEDLMEMERLRERNVALRAQQEILLRLIGAEE